MEVTAINKKTTYFEHEVTIVINHKTYEYWVNSAFTETGQSWVQNYSKKRRGLSLTTSEQKQIKKYFETEFLNYANYKNDNSIHNPSPLE